MTPTALARLFERSLHDLDLEALVARALATRRQRPTTVVAIGKAAPAMAAGALTASTERCIVVVPDGAPLVALRRAAAHLRLGERLVVVVAGHPLPDARSVHAARMCLEAAAAPGGGDLLVLVSGGASALVCAPSDGVTLRDKRALTAALLRSGSSIQELNVVRKHLSRIKGGGLLRAAGEKRVETLVASDVIGGTIADVGSGPSVPDVSSVRSARRLMGAHAAATRLTRLPLVATLSPDDAARVRARLIASPEALARAVAVRLRGAGLRVRVLAPSQANVDVLAAEYASHARGGPIALVRAAEPAVPVTGRGGQGGRSTHLATLVGRAVNGLPNVVFAAFASDGVDGTSGTAGAIVDGRFAARVGAPALERALRRFDTGPLHRAAGTALPAAPSGHNLADIHVCLVSRRVADGWC